MSVLKMLAVAVVFVMPVAAGAQTVHNPGDVMYTFDQNPGECNPDDWTFFGYAQQAFGSTTDTDGSDGLGAYQFVDWDACDSSNPGLCGFAGATIGMGSFSNCHGAEGGAGISDANFDVSAGTGISVRIKAEYGTGGSFGTDTRVALILLDNDGTTAVTPGEIDQMKFSAGLRSAIHDHSRVRFVENAGGTGADYMTVTFLFDSLTSLWDMDHSTHGSTLGLDLTHIKTMTLFWYRGCDHDLIFNTWDCAVPGAASGKMAFYFDDITLVGTNGLTDVDNSYQLNHLYADADTSGLPGSGDGDIDLEDFSHYQACITQGPVGDCEYLDSNDDGVFDSDDLQVFDACLKGPNITIDTPRNIDDFLYYYGWCYPTLIEDGYVTP